MGWSHNIPIPPLAMFSVSAFTIAWDCSDVSIGGNKTRAISVDQVSLGESLLSSDCTSGGHKVRLWYSASEPSQSLKWASPSNGQKKRGAYGLSVRALPTIPERVETPIFTMIIRRKAFTVLGLISIPEAICLVVSPLKRYCRTSLSRVVRLNLSETSPIENAPLEFRSKIIASEHCESPWAIGFTR